MFWLAAIVNKSIKSFFNYPRVWQPGQIWNILIHLIQMCCKKCVWINVLTNFHLVYLSAIYRNPRHIFLQKTALTTSSWLNLFFLLLFCTICTSNWNHGPPTPVTWWRLSQSLTLTCIQQHCGPRELWI